MTGAALRVALDRTLLQIDTGGSARALHALEAALRARPDVAVLAVESPPAGGRLVRGVVREAWWMPVAVSRRARALGAQLLHCPSPVAPVRGRLPVVITAYDALIDSDPEWFTRANVLHHALIARRALRNAAVVLCSTQHARDALVAAHGLDPARMVVAPLGVDGRFAPGAPDQRLLAGVGVRAPYLLAVGTMQPRKNIESVLAAFEALDAAGAGLQLVVAGSRGWGDERLAAALRRSAAAPRIVLPGRVDDTVLVELYRGASAFVFPSRGEGFGLPVLEAMACGVPVVCSDRSSLPEVAGGAALLADPDDPAAIEAAIATALDGRHAERLRRAGLARAAGFTWDRCAEHTVGAYRLALS